MEGEPRRSNGVPAPVVLDLPGLTRPAKDCQTVRYFPQMRRRRDSATIICVAGDIHGEMASLYEDVLAFEIDLGVRFAWVLHVGDFGVWPDPTQVDRATRKHDGAGEFSAWLGEDREVPRKTVFIKGNHEDFDWLDSQHDSELLPGLFYLRNGAAMNIGCGPNPLRIGGLGGCYGPSDYERQSGALRGREKRHYTRDEIARLRNAGPIDVLLLHAAPTGVKLRDGRNREWTSDAAGLDQLVASVKPQVCFFGHHHVRVDAEVGGVRCIGLNKAGSPGNLVALELNPAGAGWTILGEWPEMRNLARIILRVRVSGPLEIELCFDTGEIVKRNFSSLAKKGGVFAPFNDPTFFARVRVSRSKRAIEWPGELDMCADALYDNGRSIGAQIRKARSRRKAKRQSGRGS
jgi:predicted phosphodiesterase